jgi:hypothetical protein
MPLHQKSPSSDFAPPEQIKGRSAIDVRIATIDTRAYLAAHTMSSLTTLGVKRIAADRVKKRTLVVRRNGCWLLGFCTVIRSISGSFLSTTRCGACDGQLGHLTFLRSSKHS